MFMSELRKAALCAALLLPMILLPSCGANNTSPAAAPATTTKAAVPSGNQVIYVGTMGTYSPYTFTDDNGVLTGYDVETVRLLGQRIPGVTVEFIKSPWDSLFLGLDSKRYDMIANQISRTPEREQKYLFTDKGYIYVQSQLVIRANDTKHASLADFKGETLGGITGDYFTQMMEDYNKAHGNLFKMQYYGEDYTSIFMDLDAGRIAGTLNDSTVVSYTAKTLGLKIKCVGDVLEESYSYFCFRDDASGRDLKAKIDKAMDEVRADGSLKELSMKWFGADYTDKGQ